MRKGRWRFAALCIQVVLLACFATPVPALQECASRLGGPLASHRCNHSAACECDHATELLAGTAVQGARQRAKPLAATLAEIRAENDWKNDLVLWPLSQQLRAAAPRIVLSWIRNYLMCLGLFVGVAAVWAWYIYVAFGDALFRGRSKPRLAQMTAQIGVWCTAIPLYATMPAAIEAAAEAGWTRTYSRVCDVGLVAHVACFSAFMAVVEAGVYVMHRWLHDVRLYRSLHHIHHLYNKPDALSPFAGLAFHPLDGIMQALPYCAALFVIPMHFTTFELLLLATGVWTTNIHDTVDGKVPPLLGAGYHTLHHITSRCNFGHYTTYMDALCGTLLSPADFEEAKRRRQEADPQLSPVRFKPQGAGRA